MAFLPAGFQPGSLEYFITDFRFLNYLVNPTLGTTGAKIFQLTYKNGLLITAIASLVAFSSWLLEDVLLYKQLTKRSLGIIFALRVISLIILLIFVLLIISIYHYHNQPVWDLSEYLDLIKSFFLNRVTLYLLLVGILISSFINFFKAIRQKVGFEGFLRIISGYYRVPKEEDRIFIFIDLISSTRIAEILGHQKYSAFLQHCFEPLGLLEIKYRAMQYQIVGDEVVLSWLANKPQNFRYAVDFYYEFTEILGKKADVFMHEFGLIPAFAASINTGKIMVSEVGTVKSEIAFHGDVLNTAARIQKLCKSYGKRLLVTRAFSQKFSLVSSGYKIEWITNDRLIGKQKHVDICAIEPDTES
ncbi:adenylate/guanylate cyclase domain-containing protein [Gaoshiqia sediminis]|uniref:Adenylate/guanylate cyclase domain-containing protein n=1 Tax=Gaoshiqia sediminis TaxID=2986998 RepID=A0AA41YBD0_9BACT|nr:adenylate/guanylate cyclase domain-containing protein [Gaoshiqia sediminis]MCW0484603.1 adenylate/guanylate cyclase domain-containing protein [Gaoshiqia sediminis]